MVQRNPTLFTLSPRHAGKRLTYEEFERSEWLDGFHYELIEGVLHVSPSPDPYANDIAAAIARLLDNYLAPNGQRAFVNVVCDPRILVRDDPELTTNPEPDVAAYTKYPPKPLRSYKGVYPALVVEIVTPGSIDKDYIRNRALYQAVAEILEYWVIDPTENLSRPCMTVFRRTIPGGEFEVLEIASGGTYESAQWPGLSVDMGRIAVD